MHRYEFTESLKQELIESGQASKIFLDYIDERIQREIEAYMVNHIGDIEESLEEKIQKGIKKYFKRNS